LYWRNSFVRTVSLLIAGIASVLAAPMAGPAATPISVYGAWHCGNDYCTWGTIRSLADFDAKNHWIVDRGDGTHVPSVNVVVLSFVNPLKLLSLKNDATTSQGIPIGMTPDIVNYFKSKNIRVMLSIGGITYVDDWNTALATNARQLGINAAYTAHRLGVGIEIDYEENSSPNLAGLQEFINGYRSYVYPPTGMNTLYDASGVNPAARLTIDLAAGDRWLIGLTRKATADWLNTTNPVLDYANAMVPSRQPRSASDAVANWQEHIDGKPQYGPPILPLAPARFTGSLYIAESSKPLAECVNFLGSLEDKTGNYVSSVLSKVAGATSGMLGYMFWAAECPATRGVCTTPPNDCLGGVGRGSRVYSIPVPMQPLRQF
jgi:hypothetical protein